MSGRPSWKSAKIGLFPPFSAFFALFRRVQGAPGKSRKRRKKAFFLRYPQICLNPHLLNPHFRHSNSKQKGSRQTDTAAIGEVLRKCKLKEEVLHRTLALSPFCPIALCSCCTRSGNQWGFCTSRGDVRSLPLYRGTLT